VITYRATLDVHPGLVRFLARLLAAERRRRRTPAQSRKPSCRGQAVLALRWFRDRTRIQALARDHGTSRATAYRYVDEAVDVLAARAPDLAGALERALADGVPYVILDGKLFGTDACAGTAESAKGTEFHVWYSGRKRSYGANVQAVMGPGGLPLWTGPAEPGSVPDIDAARVHGPAVPVPRRRPRPAGPGRRRLPGRRHRCPYPGQEVQAETGHRAAGTGREPAHPQPAAARAALPGRTRLCPACPPLGGPAARHRQPRPPHRHNPRRPRPDPLGTQVPTANSLRSPGREERQGS
jgi:hypothetical protein